jgi:hypothetical protein
MDFGALWRDRVIVWGFVASYINMDISTCTVNKLHKHGFLQNNEERKGVHGGF